MPERSAAELKEAWGKTLKAERKSRRLWQPEVAEMARLSQATVSAAEGGQGSLETFLAIAEALDITLFEQVAP